MKGGDVTGQVRASRAPPPSNVNVTSNLLLATVFTLYSITLDHNQSIVVVVVRTRYKYVYN